MKDVSLAIAEWRVDGSAVLTNGSVLRPRELEVLSLIARGMRNREIAAEFFLSVHTVEFHVANVFQKLGARNRTEAGVTAAQIGLLIPEAQSTGQHNPAATHTRPKPPESLVIGTRRRPSLTWSSRKGRAHVVKAIRSWLAGRVVYAVPRMALISGVLVVLLITSAKVTATLDLDENLLGRRLDTWALGHPEPLHCATPPEAEAPYRDDTRFPPRIDSEGLEKALVTFEFYGQKVRALPGTICFQSEQELFAYFGKDPETRYCVRTEPRPTALEDVQRIQITELLPASGAQCFRSVDEMAAYFGFPPLTMRTPD